MFAASRRRRRHPPWWGWGVEGWRGLEVGDPEKTSVIWRQRKQETPSHFCPYWPEMTLRGYFLYFSSPLNITERKRSQQYKVVQTPAGEAEEVCVCV